MDPNANLAEQESILTVLAQPSRESCDADINRRERRDRHQLQADLRQYRQFLATWLADGGREPTWAKYPRAAKYYRTRFDA